MADEFTLQSSGLFDEPSGLSFLQAPSTASQFSLFGQPFEGSLLNDPSFSSQMGFDLGGIGQGIGLDMFFDSQTGRVVSRQEAEALSAEMGGNPEAGLPQPGTIPPKPGLGSQIGDLLGQNKLLSLFLLLTGGLGLAGVGQSLAGGGGKQVTQKTEVEQQPRTPLEENLFALANQMLLSGGPGIPSLASLGGGAGPGNFTAPSAGASNSILEALTSPRAASAPNKYRESLLRLRGT